MAAANQVLEEVVGKPEGEPQGPPPRTLALDTEEALRFENMQLHLQNLDLRKKDLLNTLYSLEDARRAFLGEIQGLRRDLAKKHGVADADAHKMQIDFQRKVVELP